MVSLPSSYVLLTSGGTREWTYTSSSNEGSVDMVGTCNGLLCLHDHSSYGGISFSAVRVTNPVTGETLALPPVPEQRSWSQFYELPGEYSFGFHPATKRHKVVYIPRGRRWSVTALQVFTLGDDTTSWREVPVPTPGACYDLPCEPVSVGGSTYWLAGESSDRVMALDLGDERITSLDMLPAMVPTLVWLHPDVAAGRNRRQLTKVHNSLGIVVPSLAGVNAVWVLDGGGGEKPQWSRRYTVGVAAWGGWWVVAPQLTHGDYILSEWLDEPEDRQYTTYYRRRTRALHLCRHKVGELTDGGGGKIGPPRPPKEAKLIMSKEERRCQFTTFTYVETLNPVPGSSK